MTQACMSCDLCGCTLPPGNRSKLLAPNVSPGLGMRSTLSTRSALTLPTTTRGGEELACACVRSARCLLCTLRLLRCSAFGALPRWQRLQSTQCGVLPSMARLRCWLTLLPCLGAPYVGLVGSGRSFWQITAGYTDRSLVPTSSAFIKLISSSWARYLRI